VLSRSIQPKRRGRRALTVLATFSVVAGLLLASGTALAVHDDGFFELDRNTITQPAPGDDWENLYGTDGTDGATTLADPSQFDGFTFVNDKIGTQGDVTYWTGGGSKDRNDISQWQWGANDQSPDKNDLVNAFAAAYDGDHLYFGADRYITNGDAQMGFWFLVSPTCLAGTTTNGVLCPNTNPGKFVDPTTGDVAHHTDGDLLALVNFNNGGTIGLAGVYEWVGGVSGAPVQRLVGTGADCTSIGANDDFCTTTNTADILTEPVWPYISKKQGKNIDYYQASAFVEGGIDLGAIPGAPDCFATFLAETRSSSGPSTGLSLDAQLKDLAFGQFLTCGAEVVTTPTDNSGTAIPAGGISIGTGSVQVKDSADIDVSGIDEWDGAMKFYLCGPIATGTCDGTTNKGVKIGADIPVDETTVMPVSSVAATVTSAGRYCWRGFLDSATTGLPDATDASAGECFVVNPVTPTLDTAAVASPVNFGQPVQDNATLSGTATQPGTNGPGDADGAFKSINATGMANAGGKITFTLLKANCTDLATGTGTNPQDFTPINGNGTYGPVSFTPDAPGTYHWKAQYVPVATDVNNIGSTHNGSCNDADETVVVSQVPSSITTRQFHFPQDKAVITATGGGNLAGSVTFKLYDSVANCTANGATGLLYTSAALPISGASPQSATTSNTTARVSTDTIYAWRVTFTSTNQAQLGSSSVCTETTDADFEGQDGSIALP